MDYEKDTREAYRNESKAKDYQEQYTKGTKWARFTMWRQRLLIDKIIRQCGFNKNDKILDIPCGTGFIGRILCKTPAHIYASDISTEMMRRARGEYEGDNFKGFVQCDITQTPFNRKSFDCIFLLAFMHRLPQEVRHETWKEIVNISKKYVVVNYSVDSFFQRVKHWLLIRVHPDHIPAPSSLRYREIISEINSYGLIIRKVYSVAYIFSAKVIFVLEKGYE